MKQRCLLSAMMDTSGCLVNGNVVHASVTSHDHLIQRVIKLQDNASVRYLCPSVHWFQFVLSGPVRISSYLLGKRIG